MNIDIFPTIAAILNREISGVKLLDGRNIWALLNGSAVSPHKKLYLFNNEDVAAVRTQEWKYVVRGYYRQNYVAFDRFKKGFGFSYPLLFNMTEMLPERYSTAINHPDVVEEMKELLSTGRREFDPMRTKPVPKAFP